MRERVESLVLFMLPANVCISRRSRFQVAGHTKRVRLLVGGRVEQPVVARRLEDVNVR